MKVFKKVKAVGAAGLAALMLTISVAGITANAASLPNPDTCHHSWTAEEYAGERIISTSTHVTNDGKTCTITIYAKYYRTVCRICGKVMSTREEPGTRHSLNHVP